MEIIKTSSHVLCLSTPFKSYRILQDSISEQVEQTLPLMYNVLLEDGRWKCCWRSPAHMISKFHWSPQWVCTAEGTILALAWCDWVLTMPVISPSLPPTFPICCHWHTHITLPRTWFSWKYHWGGREAVTMQVNRSCLQLDWLKLILEQHPQNPKRLFLIASIKMRRESATPFNCIGIAKAMNEKERR